MAEMSFTLKIPALDRLCAILEGWEKEKPIDLLATKEAPLVEVPKTKVAPEAVEGPKQPPKAEPVQIPAPAPEPAQPVPLAAPAPEPAQPAPVAAPAKPSVTVDDLMRAAAALRDEGKLLAVTGLFPDFGIQKISDLKANQLDAFAEKLRGLGAQV